MKVNPIRDNRRFANKGVGITPPANSMSSNRRQESAAFSNGAKARVVYELVPASKVGVIKPLWEVLNRHHWKVSPDFRRFYETFTFEARKKMLLTGGKKLRIEIARDRQTKKPAAYCASSIKKSVGEVDSLLVLPGYRGLDIGKTLMKNALKWFRARKVSTTRVVVVSGNDKALSFYSQFGFLVRSRTMELKPEKK